MPGSKIGGLKARDKNLAKNPNFYSDIGKIGARKYMEKPKEERRPRGFAANPELARKAGAVGGKRSRRGSK
jgi:general stress protein YciG